MPRLSDVNIYACRTPHVDVVEDDGDAIGSGQNVHLHDPGTRVLGMPEGS